MCKGDLNKTATCASRHTAQLYQGIRYVLNTKRFHAACINLISSLPVKQHSLVCADFHELRNTEQHYVHFSYTKFHSICPLNFESMGRNSFVLCKVRHSLH